MDRTFSTSPPPRSRVVVTVLLLLWLLLTVNLWLAVALYQVNILTWDQWDFYRPLFQSEGLWAVFTFQHGPHRQGLGFVLTSSLLAGTQWDSRWDSMWIAGLRSLAGLFASRLKWLDGNAHAAHRLARSAPGELRTPGEIERRSPAPATRGAARSRAGHAPRPILRAQR